MDITELLAFGVQQGASDLHLSAGLPPMIRVDGDIRRVNLPPQTPTEVQALIYDIMNDRQRKEYEENLEVDFSGLDVEDRYLFGYGMDYRGYWRNAAGIYAVKGL